MAGSEAQRAMFRLPVELWWDIFDYLNTPPLHLSYRGQHVVLSDCLTPNPSCDDDGAERYPEVEATPHNSTMNESRWGDAWYDGMTCSKGSRDTDAIMAKRLRSTWGPHWRCEAASSDGDLGVRKLLLVCKHIEAIEYMVHRLIFHITDLNTLDALCQTQHTAEGLPKTTSLISIGHGMQALHVTLRLPFEIFEAVDGLRSESKKMQELALQWTQAWPAVAALKGLRKIRVELDHTNWSSWSVINERAVLSSLGTLKALVPGLVLTVVLPNLHPFYEKSDRHFTHDSPEPSFPIIRRVRQKYHCRQGPDGRRSIVRSRYDTFPVWVPAELELLEIEEHPVPQPSPEQYREMVEEERQGWRNGIDYHDFIAELLGSSPICYG
ncbi:hypothetical protein D7B24_007386 [Verticillium nonalfalfae]|uniref:DUF7730 domain-containing protein n=1 Tax=Verticillium nonalfalfae TaxID=1051616 RepID=A0A3M9Y7W2_9PEZI|nr:uncharacterized protein D7B24_007386 [Verticillium nonalfalfae]RNJ56331.1 hypothetical protein D7B24_007386 [Verticillium nonalfalfae]